MYKILIVGALSQEINVVKEEIKKLALRDIKTSYLTTGIGNYNMILNLTRFLENNDDFDFIINIGVCGISFDFSLFQRERPEGSTLGVYSRNEREGLEKVFQIARILNLSNNKELIIPKILDFGELVSIACSEKVVYDKNDLQDELYVDMESYGFERVCDSFSIPRIILKLPVDIVGEETKNFDFNKAKKSLSQNIDYKLLFEKIYDYLENTFSFQRKIKEKEVFEKYKEYFGFTFSENEIFKRLYYRYLALVSDNFDIFFSDNNELSKKDFLKKLDEYLEGFLIK